MLKGLIFASIFLYTTILTTELALPENTNTKLKQDEGDSEDGTTSRPVNGHLIGTIAGVISSILRSGPNGTYPIQFNLTNFQERLQKFQLFPIKLPFTKETIEKIQSESNVSEKKSKKRKIIYRNPSSEKKPLETVEEIQVSEDEYDEVPVAFTKSKITTSTTQFNEEPFLVTTTFKTKIIPTTTEEEVVVVTQNPIRTTTTVVPSKGTTIYSEPFNEPVTAINSVLDIALPDLGTLVHWANVYGTPVDTLLSTAAKTVNVTKAVENANGFVKQLPLFIETIAGVVGVGIDYFGPERGEK